MSRRVNLQADYRTWSENPNLFCFCRYPFLLDTVCVCVCLCARLFSLVGDQQCWKQKKKKNRRRPRWMCCTLMRRRTCNNRYNFFFFCFEREAELYSERPFHFTASCQDQHRVAAVDRHETGRVAAAGDQSQPQLGHRQGHICADRLQAAVRVSEAPTGTKKKNYSEGGCCLVCLRW